MPQNNLLGEAGKFRVASELLLRGFHVLLPASDEGVDLFTEEGHGIQVKASRRGAWQYSFSFRFWTCKAGEKKQRFGRLHAKVTHVVLWCVDDDALIVIPRAEIKDPKHVTVSLTTGRSQWCRFLEAWDSFKDTKTLAQASTQ